ncbi:MAG: MlaD family protein [Candidatus Gastranaerophilales bacterium]|nr:MlaD family protein [Candidatus Gastranaerophilales bacterium]
MKFTPALKVGIITILSLMILIMSIMWLKGRALTGANRIDVIFKDVDGMRAGSGVQIMGLRVGQVEEITPFISTDLSYVKVKFVITEPGVEVPLGAEISIQQSGIIGEKFIEITPPVLREAYIPLSDLKNGKLPISKGDAVQIYANIDDKVVLKDIGNIKAIEMIDIRLLPISLQKQFCCKTLYKISYIVTTPGLTLPENLTPSVAYHSNVNKLLLNTYSKSIYYEETGQQFTVIEPVRIKEFLDMQIEAARALNETNNKINSILSDEVVNDVRIALSNVKDISLKTSELIDKTTILVEGSRNDIDKLLKMANKLSEELAILANNVNSIAGDPEFKKSVIETTKSVNESSKQICKLLKDDKTQQTLDYLNETAKNLSEISATVNELSKDDDIKKKVNLTVDNMNKSMSSLSSVLAKVDNMSCEDQAKIKSIIDDTKDTSENLKKFSEKLNKRFLLFRLLF